jgi:hypothetical protein
MHIPNPEPPVEETLAGVKETDPKYSQTLVGVSRSSYATGNRSPSA